VTQRFKTLRAVLATAVFATGAAGIATAGASGCDPMYPCYTDASTPAAVYDLAARTGIDSDQTSADTARTPALTGKGLGGRDGGTAGAAVYDLATRTDHAPCESYPCYPEQAKAATPIAAEAAVTERTFDPRS
jgi:hypothetical protein